MLKKIICGVFIVVLLLIIINFNSINYVSGIISDQIGLVSKADDIDKVINDKQIDEEIINQLKLIPEIMQFGDEVGFPQTKAYSKYITLQREVFLHSLSASDKEKFKDYLWEWPFVGGLPYKGFIEKDEALKEQSKLEKENYDTYLGESSAMSTLGILPDPIITTMINESDVTVLINTIYHERTHQLFFKKDSVIFNENSAVLLGSMTALGFLKEKFGEDSEEYQTQLNRINDKIVFSRFIDEFYNELDKLYSSNLSSDEKIKKREEIFQKRIKKFKTVKEKLNKSFKNFDHEEVNNAHILSLYRYYGKLHNYYKVYEKLGNNLQETIAFFNEVAYSSEDPDRAISEFIVS